MNIELHFIDKNGVDQGLLPDCQKIDVSPVANDYGTVAFDYPKAGKNWSLMKGLDEFEVATYINGVKRPELGAIMKEISADDVSDTPIFQYSGLMMLTLLDEGLVYPNNWPSYNPKAPSHQCNNFTAGMFMGRFINLAQQRGALQGITWNSFSPSLDSNGQAWTKQISLEIKPGSSVSEVLMAMYADGLCEFRMVGRDLRLYNPGTLTADRTLQNPPLTFRKGRDLRDSPRKISSREVSTVFLGAGKDDSGTYAEEVNATAVASRRRIEGFASNGNISDSTTLHGYLQLQLQKSSGSKMEKTSGLEFVEPYSPQPLRDFDIGDWAFLDTDGTQERLRIKQWVLSKAQGGSVSGSVTMNDVFGEAAEVLAKRIDGIIGGTTISGESKAVDVIPGAVYDNLAPATPAMPVCNTSTYVSKQGTTLAQVTASWPAVTTNADGSALTDLAGYRVAWQSGSIGPGVHYIEMGNLTTVGISPLGTDIDVQVNVQAVDKYGNASAWSPTATIHTGKDSVAPEAPGGLSMDNYMGLARLIWTGATASGAAWPVDFSYAEVHFSSVNNFTPTYGAGGTLSDSLTGAGKSFSKGVYGNIIYARMVAVDTSGNKSVPSAVVSVTPTQVVSSDVFDGAIGTAKLADLAVTTAKIANLAVNAAQIGSVNAGSIVAGAIAAELTVSARIATALTGQRVELNSIGVQGWDTGGTLTMSLNGIDNLLMGTLKTAITGRRIEILASGSRGEVSFYGPAGQLGQVRGFTSDLGVSSQEAIEVRYPISGVSPSWNSMAITSAEEMYFATGWVQYTVGGNGTGNKGFQVRFNGTTTRGTPSTLYGTGNARFQIDSTSTQIIGPLNDVIAAFWNTSGSNWWNRFRAGDTAGNFGGVIDIIFYRSDTSPAVRMLAPNLTSGAHMYWDSSSLFVSFTNGAANAYTDLRAASFNTTSDEAAKKSIRKFTGAREKLAPLEPHTYALKGGKHVNGRRRLGFMAATAPDEVRILPHPNDKIQHEGIDMYGLLTLGIQYSKEIDSDVEALRREIAELRELVSSR